MPLIDPSADKRSKTTGRTYKMQLQLEHGIVTKKAINNIEDGIQRVKNMMHDGLLIFFNDLKYTLKEGCEYRYPTLEERNKNKNLGEKPLDKNNHCLTGDTLIHTIDGLIPIKDLVGKEGKVYCYDEENQIKTVSEFFDVRKTRENAEIIQIETDKGIIKCTPDHLILTTNGWVEAGKLDENSLIISIEKTAKVLKITHLKNEDVYNMEVKKHHNFAVNGGLIVHNCMDCLRYICQEIPYTYLDMKRASYSNYMKFFEKQKYSSGMQANSLSFKEMLDIINEDSVLENMSTNTTCAGGYTIC